MILCVGPAHPYGFMEAYLQLLKYCNGNYQFDCSLFLDVVELQELDIKRPIAVTREGIERDFCVYTCWGYTEKVRKLWLALFGGMNRAKMHYLYYLFIKFMERFPLRKGRWLTLQYDEAEKTLLCLLTVLRDKGSVELEHAMKQEWEDKVVGQASQRIMNACSEALKATYVEHFFFNFGNHEKYLLGLKISRGLELNNDEAFESVHGNSVGHYITLYESMYGPFQGVFTEKTEKDDRLLLENEIV